MKKLLSNKKAWIGIAIVILAIVLFFVFRKQISNGGMSLTKRTPDTTPDPWAGLRQSLGTYDKKGEDDKMWTAAGHVFLSDITNHTKKNELIPPYWRAMYAWFKGHNIRPDGWKVITNQSLQSAIKAYVASNGGIAADNVVVGQYL